MKNSLTHIVFSAAFLSLFLLTGCESYDFLGSKKDDAPPLEGERISILELEKNLIPDRDLEGELFSLPAMWQNISWPQAGGYPSHSMQNLFLNRGALKRVWTADIGSGSSKDLPLTAQPVVANGRIFTLDSKLNLRAFSVTNGQRLWQSFVGSEEEEDLVIGGGLGIDGGKIFVTTGYNDVLAINLQDGQHIWRTKLRTPTRAAPTALGGRVFVSTLSNSVLALNADTGEVLWEFSGMGEATGILGSASPAANKDIVVPAFSSGEIYALRVENGSVAWSENLSALRRFGGLESLSDIRGLPVIDRGHVYAISFGGKMLAIDERTGTRIWQRDIGGSETPWVADNTVFVLTTENALVALARDNGAIRWVQRLRRFQNEEERTGPIYWHGPILAGDRLFVANSEGTVAEIDPSQGEVIRSWNSNHPIAMPPLVAGDTLYLLSRDGTLLAYK